MKGTKHDYPKIHFSIDDVWQTFEILFSNELSSIFEVPLFNLLYKYHVKFGLKVTLYMVGQNGNNSILKYDTRFNKDFERNSDWLKFGLHCTKLVPETEDAYKDYFEYLNKLEEIVGTKSMSSFVRLHGFNCPNNIIKNMNSYNIHLLLCADDCRNNYGLTTAENNRILKQNYLQKDKLIYLKTSFRLENNDYTQMSQNNSKSFILPIFTHEYFFYGKRKLLGLYMMKKLLIIAKKQKLSFCNDLNPYTD